MNQYNIPAVAGRIFYLRRLHGFTLDEAAQQLGIQRRSLSNIESGAKGCSIDLLVRISEVYGSSLDYLVLGRNLGNTAAKAALQETIQALIRLRDEL